MGRSLKLHSKKVVLHSAAAALATPSGVSAGGATSTWKQGAQAPRGIALAIDAIGGGVTLQDAVLCVYDDDPDAGVPMWRQVAILNNDQDIIITTTFGWEEVFFDVAINSRLAVKATLSGNAVTVTAKPVEILP